MDENLTLISHPKNECKNASRTIGFIIWNTTDFCKVTTAFWE